MCSVQLLSRVRLFATPWITARQASLSISQSSLTLMSIKSVMLSSHLILCCPLLLLPSIFPSIRVFSNESVLHIRWPKDWSFSFSISPSSEYSGLIPFRMDCFVFPAVQERLSRVFSNTTVRKHQFFSTQPSLWPNSNISTWLLEKPWLWLSRTLSAKSLLQSLTTLFSPGHRRPSPISGSHPGWKVFMKVLQCRHELSDALLFLV